ncbi:MAG: hypothetical protein JWQ78_660 [Sediminibacterium sp.]|nr:hypothetical protein [Sediminibacterium sp.]
MDTLRFNPFHQIHQGLRAMLYHCSLAVQHTDFTDAQQTESTLSLIAELVALFEEHAHTEDTLVFPMISQYAPHVVIYFEQQHEKDHQLGEELNSCMEKCNAASTGGERMIAGQQLQRALTEFSAFNLTHMNQEETIVLNIIWQHFTDRQLLAKQVEITAFFTPEKKARAGYWILKGLATHEIIGWVRSIKQNAPAFALDQFIDLAEKALPKEKFKRVKESLESSLAE